MDERELFRALKAGNKKAFNILYDLLYEKVCFFSEQITRDQMEAEDIAIHSLAKFWERGAYNFDCFMQVKSFIFKTARNACFNYLKKVNLRKTHHQHLIYYTNVVDESAEERAELALYKAEMVQFLVDEIERLPDQCRETFKLVFIQKIPRHLVAEKLNISLDTVNSHCANGKKKLRRIFSERELCILFLLASMCNN